MNELTIIPNDLSANITPQTLEYISQAKAEATVQAYKSDWNHFQSWCEDNNQQSLPASPQTLAAYLSDLASNHKTSTVARRLAAISKAHQTANVTNPANNELVRLTIKGIRRVKGTRPTQKVAAVTSDILAMLNTLPDNLLGKRDRALLLIGFAGAFRRSELVSLNIEDLDFRADGIAISLKRSKTDQEGEGATKGIPYGRCAETCPVRALKAWLECAGITEGVVFRSVNRHGQVGTEQLNDKTVARVVKRAAEAAGLDPSNYSGHSLRAGLATSAAMNGVSERDIMRQTGHHSVQMVRRYIRDGELFKSNAASQVGL